MISMNFLKGKIEKHDELQFVSGTVKFGIPNELGLREKLEPYVNNEIIFGFRPEYLYDKKLERQKQLSVDLSIIIDVREPIGSEAYNYFHFEGNNEETYCFRTDSAFQYKSGEEVKVGIDVQRLRFFDAKSEVRIA